MSNASPELPPGFRFHPTDEELIVHYLCKRAASPPCPVAIIADVDIYKYNPWDLPAKAMFGEREWYFFSPRDRKYPNGVRPNRAAASGYWKATGTDKPITTSRRNENIGVKKALVFYKGKPPKGLKTNWIMHEYRLTEAQHNIQFKPVKPRESSMRLDDWVLCRIYQKTRNHFVDCEQEESASEDAGMKNLTNANKMHKSFSLSELLMEEADFSLLSRLLETPMLEPITDHAPLSNSSLTQSFTKCISNTNVSCFLNSQVTLSDTCDLVGDNSLKRQRMVDDYYFNERGGQLNPSKKLSNSHIYSQFDNQFDLSQPFFNQDLLLSSHLGNALS